MAFFLLKVWEVDKVYMCGEKMDLNFKNNDLKITNGTMTLTQKTDGKCNAERCSQKKLRMVCKKDIKAYLYYIYS